jgi:hypothetical chaperone protein
MAIDCIGIDFGTTNTCVAVKENGKVRVLTIDPTSPQTDLIRTLIYIPSKKDSFFGRNAIDRYFDDGMEGRFFQSIKKLLPNPDFTGTSVFGVRMGVESLIAKFLTELKKRIEAEIGPIGEIPIHMGRPARYSLDSAREELAVTRFKKSIELAGFKNFTLIDEPTAAAESASQKESGRPTEGSLVLVCDLGGGTSDFTLFRSNAKASIKTLSVYGVPIAGDSLDSDFFKERLNPHFGSTLRYTRALSSNVLTLPSTFIRILPKWHHHALLKERSTWNFILALRNELVDEHQKKNLENLITLVEENLGYMLHQQVEKLKIALSAAQASPFSFSSYPVKIEFDVETADYEKMIEPSVLEIEEAAIETLRLGNCDPLNVDILQFTGGTAKVPLIRQRIQKRFPNARVIEAEAFTAVAEGLAQISQLDEGATAQ